MRARETAGRWLTMLAVLWGCSITCASPSGPVETSEGSRASWLITRSPLPGPSGRSTHQGEKQTKSQLAASKGGRRVRRKRQGGREEPSETENEARNQRIDQGTWACC
eukprot:721198-Hanusia_phi.AAC.1